MGLLSKIGLAREVPAEKPVNDTEETDRSVESRGARAQASVPARPARPPMPRSVMAQPAATSNQIRQHVLSRLLANNAPAYEKLVKQREVLRDEMQGVSPAQLLRLALKTAGAAFGVKPEDIMQDLALIPHAVDTVREEYTADVQTYRKEHIDDPREEIARKRKQLEELQQEAKALEAEIVQQEKDVADADRALSTKANGFEAALAAILKEIETDKQALGSIISPATSAPAEKGDTAQ